MPLEEAKDIKTPLGRNNRREEILYHELDKHNLPGHVRYLSLSSATSVKDMILDKGQKAYVQYVKEFLKMYGDPTTTKVKIPPRIMPYTLVEYGTDTGSLSLHLSLEKDTQNGISRMLTDVPLSESTIAPPAIGYSSPTSEKDTLQAVYKVIVGKTSNVENIISKCQEAWRRALRLGASGTDMEKQAFFDTYKRTFFDPVGRLYVNQENKEKTHVFPTPSGAFHVVIDPNEIDDNERLIIMRHLLHTNVHILSIYAKGPDELVRMNYLPESYLYEKNYPKLRALLETNVPPIQVFFNHAEGMTETQRKSLRHSKSSRSTQISVAPDQYRRLYTILLQSDEGKKYVNAMKCVYPRPKREENKSLSIRWIVNHHLRKPEKDDPYRDYIDTLELEGKQIRLAAGEKVRRKKSGDVSEEEGIDLTDSEEECDKGSDVSEKDESSSSEEEGEDDDEEEEERQRVVPKEETKTGSSSYLDSIMNAKSLVDGINNAKTKPLSCEKRKEIGLQVTVAPRSRY